MAKKTTAVEQPVVYTALEADKNIETLLCNLYHLQKIESSIDKVQKIKGELPEIVNNLQDSIEGLHTRINNLTAQIADYDAQIKDKNNQKADWENTIQSREKQLNKVRNIREHDSINNEINDANLNIELCEKDIRSIENSKKLILSSIESCKESLALKEEDLSHKQNDLQTIEEKTAEIENKLRIQQDLAEQRLINNGKGTKYLEAFKRIRNASHNGLAVVKVDRDACGGCFNKVTKQRQIDVKMHKKILFCEYCGRFLVDEAICDPIDEEFNAEFANEEILK